MCLAYPDHTYIILPFLLAPSIRTLRNMRKNLTIPAHLGRYRIFLFSAVQNYGIERGDQLGDKIAADDVSERRAINICEYGWRITKPITIASLFLNSFPDINVTFQPDASLLARFQGRYIISLSDLCSDAIFPSIDCRGLVAIAYIPYVMTIMRKVAINYARYLTDCRNQCAECV